MLLAAAAVGAVLLALLFGPKPAQAAFPGINGPIAFGSVGSDGDIYSLMPGDAEARQLTFSPSIRESDPKWSPDGTKIAFHAINWSNTSNRTYGIYVMNPNGTGVRQVIAGNDYGTGGYDPSWSPDGRSLIYGKQSDGVDNIYTVNLDGTGETKVTNNTSIFVSFNDPAWAPDGAKIAYSSADGDSSTDTHHGHTYVANPDGSGAIRISSSQPHHYSYEGWEPGWSPDGTKVVFFESLHFVSSTDGAYGNQEIFVANKDGSGLTNLTNTTAKAYNQDETSPTWSPDGTKIAFVSGTAGGTAGNSRINYMNADGSGREAGPTIPRGIGGDLDWGVLATSPADTTKPAVKGTAPLAGATGVSPGANVTATFSEKMDKATITRSTFKLFKVTSSGTTQVTNVAVSLSADGLTATLNPFGTSTTMLAKNAKYKAVVTTGARDLAGNALDQNRSLSGDQPKSWTFTVRR